MPVWKCLKAQSLLLLLLCGFKEIGLVAFFVLLAKAVGRRIGPELCVPGVSHGIIQHLIGHDFLAYGNYRVDYSVS